VKDFDPEVLLIRVWSINIDVEKGEFVVWREKFVPKPAGMAHEFVSCRESFLHPVSKPLDMPFVSRAIKF
jgi:hypothetical protein